MSLASPDYAASVLSICFLDAASVLKHPLFGCRMPDASHLPLAIPNLNSSLLACYLPITISNFFLQLFACRMPAICHLLFLT